MLFCLVYIRLQSYIFFPPKSTIESIFLDHHSWQSQAAEPSELTLTVGSWQSRASLR
jgi:hypothetical protein